MSTYFCTLLLILQRYYFESESQLLTYICRLIFSCCLSYKDTILKANHSINYLILFIKTLLLILQRYYFESESQRDLKDDVREISCCLSYKDTILKANHSKGKKVLLFDDAVAYPTKILF